jgi:hypothetical protein
VGLSKARLNIIAACPLAILPSLALLKLLSAKTEKRLVRLITA